jgi:hypothetical protein
MAVSPWKRRFIDHMETVPVKGPSLSAVFGESVLTGLFLALYGPVILLSLFLRMGGIERLPDTS